MSDSKPAEATPSMFQYLVAGSLYASSSVSMFLVNKWTIKVFPYACSLLYLQNASTIVVLLVLGSVNSAFAIDWDTTAAVRWIPNVVFFMFNIISSLLAMKSVSVSTLVVFRNLNSIAVALGDKVFLKKHVSSTTFVSLVIIVIGSVVFGYYDLQFDAVGYFWIMVNAVSMSGYTLFVKYLSLKHKYTSFSMSFYNNVMSIVPLVFLIVWHGELHTALDALHVLSGGDLFAVVFSCCLGFCISFFGFKAQKTFSATAWITINNLNKIPAIVLGIVVFGDQFSAMSVLGLLTSMGGGFLFAYEGWRLTQVDEAAKRALPRV